MTITMAGCGSSFTQTTAERSGRAGGLECHALNPAATAKIAAAAASSRALDRRPPSVDFANFELPAGSLVTRASDIADRRSSDSDGRT